MIFGGDGAGFYCADRFGTGDFPILAIILILRHLAVLSFATDIAIGVVLIAHFAGHTVLRRLASDTLQAFNTIKIRKGVSRLFTQRIGHDSCIGIDIGHRIEG